MRRDEGFTLVEVLASMAILAVGVLALFNVFTTAVKLVQDSQERVQATTLATERLGALRQMGSRDLERLVNSGALLAPPYSATTQLDMEHLVASDAIYRRYWMSFERAAQVSTVPLHRITLNVEMLDGRVERFVTYVTEQ